VRQCGAPRSCGSGVLQRCMRFRGIGIPALTSSFAYNGATVGSVGSELFVCGCYFGLRLLSTHNSPTTLRTMFNTRSAIRNRLDQIKNKRPIDKKGAKP
jgi:hypothetical protein